MPGRRDRGGVSAPTSQELVAPARGRTPELELPVAARAQICSRPPAPPIGQETVAPLALRRIAACTLAVARASPAPRLEQCGRAGEQVHARELQGACHAAIGILTVSTLRFLSNLLAASALAPATGSCNISW
mmetsp:Transcript_14822/g.39638  ORF Transcript_14822/g.39638 Transcript_14822/m.39638 type:complete len:132 (-) Transcript_14822:1136-1531(-)